jgi:hypothetical protein
MVTSRVRSPEVFIERLLPHALFSVGEKVPEADEGAVLALKLSVLMSFHRPSMKTVTCIARAKAPSSAVGTFSPPLRNAVGRRRSMNSPG